MAKRKTRSSPACGARGIRVSGLAIAIPTDGNSQDNRPVVRAARVWTPDEVVARLLKSKGVNARLVPGGIEVSPPQLLGMALDLAASASPDGDVRIEATRVGRMPDLFITLALGLVLGLVGNKPGLSRSGPRCVDLDLRTLLAGSPMQWQAGVRRIGISGEGVEIECS